MRRPEGRILGNNIGAAKRGSLVRNRNAILVPGILRRCAAGICYDRRRSRKHPRQSTFKDLHDAMNRFSHRLAFATISSGSPDPVQKSAPLPDE